MSVVVREITSKRDKKKFFKFYQQLYKGNKYYAPPLYIEDMAEFDPKDNTIYNLCKCRMFLAYKDNKIVGRIAGLIQPRVNEKNGVKELRFTRFDTIDDMEVTNALFDTLKQWAKKEGMTDIVGPMSFTDLCEEGMLVEGFDEQSIYADGYNYSYYVDHMQALGATKVVDWMCYRIEVPDQVDDRLEKMAFMVKKKNNYSILDIAHTPKKKLQAYMMDAMDVLNEAFAKLHGTSLLDPAQQKALMEKVMMILHQDLVTVVLQNDKVVGYGLMCANLNSVLRKARGNMLRVLPQFLHAIKHPGETVDMMNIGVLDEHVNKGVATMILYNSLKGLVKNKTKYIETGRELEDNHNVQNLWKNYQRIQNRRYRCFTLPVGNTEKNVADSSAE